MKLVSAIIRPFKLEDVYAALCGMGLYCITITDVRGAGQQKGHTEVYGDTEIKVEFSPKVKIEIAIQSEMLVQVVEVIKKAAFTGKVGDGTIFVCDLEKVYRIRTEETGHAAL